MGRKHENRAKEVMLYCQKRYGSIRLWGLPTGQAFVKFSVKNAIQHAAKTKDIMGAMKMLITVVYGKPGHPDVTGIFKGIWVGIEIKVGRDKQREEQKNFQNMIEKEGGVYMLVDDKSPLEEQLVKLDGIESWSKGC